ncbi:hypothetical protein GCM10028784_20500 [Myceligenerans cantabricum]
MSIPLLYITGWTRSGSTLLGNILGELDGVDHVGELHYLWQNGVLQQGTNSLCGCGVAVADCPRWAPVVRASVTAGDHDVMPELQRRHLRTRHTLRRLLEHRGVLHRPGGAQESLRRMVALYGEMRAAGFGRRLIVDGSKFPAEPATLLGCPDIDLRVLHVVRDPRSTAVSYQSAKEYIDPMGPWRSSGYWVAFNAASEAVGRAAGDRYLRVRHEDLCASPRAVLRQIFDFAGIPDEIPMSPDEAVELGVNHTVTGNPDRLTTGATTIRRGPGWAGRLTRAQATHATVPALPLLARYHYGIAGGS